MLIKAQNKEDWNNIKNIIENTENASFLLHPDWLKGYLILPFFIRKIGYFIYDEEHNLLGVIAGIKYYLGRWVTVFPSDPVFVKETNDEDKKAIWLEIVKLTKTKVHIASILDLEVMGFKQGKFPKGIYASPGIGMVDVKESEQEFLESLKYSVRRKIKQGLSYGEGLTFEEITNAKELPQLYKALKANAEQKGYNIRPFFLFKRFWENGLNNKSFVFLKLIYQDQIIGCAVLIKSGKMLNYLMGASNKTINKLNAGYLLHNQSINICRSNHYNYYNISIGGTENVEKLKDDFGRKKINLTKQYVGFFNK